MKAILGRPTIIAILIVIFSFILFFPTKTITIDEFNYLGNANLLTQGDLRQECDGTPGQFKTQEGEFCVFKYNIGTSFFLLPAALTSVELGFLTSLGVFILTILIFSSLLKQFSLPANHIYLFAFFPPFIYYSRTLMSEIYSVFLVTLVLWLFLRMWKSTCPCIPVILGFVTGVAVLVRYSNLLPILILISLYCWQQRKSITENFIKWFGKLALVILGGGVPLIIFLWMNTQLYGSPITSGYSLSGEQSFGLSQFFPQLLAFLIALNLMYPGMLLLSITKKALKKYLFLIVPIAALIILYAAGPNNLFEGRLLDLIFGIRFVLPTIPLLLLPYFHVLAEQKWIKEWMLKATIIFLGLMVVAINSFHYTFLQQADPQFPPFSTLTIWQQ